jgi:heptosyltransferase II
VATQPELPGRSAGTPQRILVRGVNWLGDAVMTTPALQQLRARFPEAKISILTPEKFAELWRHHPSADEAIPFFSGESLWSVAGRLRAAQFQTAVVFPNSPRSALEPWLAGIPRRVGYAQRWRNWFLTQPVPRRSGVLRMRKKSVGEIRHLLRDENPSAPLGPNRNPPDETRSHQIHEYLHLVGALGARTEPVRPKLKVAPSEIQEVEAAWLSPWSSDQTLLIGLNPSAAYGPAKRWPVHAFSGVVSQVSQALPNAVWVAFGSASDHDLCEQTLQPAGPRGLNLAGKTSLRQLMALLKLCRVVLTNDSGPMHVAAALGIPVVVPFASTSPLLTAPGLPGEPGHHLLEASVPCAPCFRRSCPVDLRCMRNITVERVTAGVLSALKNPIHRG